MSIEVIVPRPLARHAAWEMGVEEEPEPRGTSFPGPHNNCAEYASGHRKHGPGQGIPPGALPSCSSPTERESWTHICL
jgi:hypothetical protein